MVPQLIAMAEGKDAHVAQGACETLGYIMKCEQALPALVGLLSHEDRWLRFKAAEAIKKMGRDGGSRPSPRFSRRSSKPPSPRSRSTGPTASNSPMASWPPPCSKDGLTESLKGVDPKLLYPAIRILSRNADGMARAKLRRYFEHKLVPGRRRGAGPGPPGRRQDPLPGRHDVRQRDPHGRFKALTKYHYKEGIEAAIVFAKTQGGHGSEAGPERS